MNPFILNLQQYWQDILVPVVVVLVIELYFCERNRRAHKIGWWTGYLYLAGMTVALLIPGVVVNHLFFAAALLLSAALDMGVYFVVKGRTRAKDGELTVSPPEIFDHFETREDAHEQHRPGCLCGSCNPETSESVGVGIYAVYRYEKPSDPNVQPFFVVGRGWGPTAEQATKAAQMTIDYLQMRNDWKDTHEATCAPHAHH